MRPVRVFVWTTLLVITAVGTGLGGFPRLEVVYPPASRFECSSESIPILGRANCEECALLVGNHAVAIENDGFFRAEVDLLPGENKVDVYLRDAGGNEYLQTLIITRNKPLPGADALKPATTDIVAPETPPEVFATPVPVRTKWSVPEQDKYPARHKLLKSPKEAMVSKRRDVQENPGPVAETAEKSSVEFFFNGKRTEASGEYIVKQNHIYLPADSSIWSDGGASVGDAGSKVIFGAEGPISPQTIETGRLGKALVNEDGRIYLPVRAVFEQGGRNVQWDSGRVYVAKQYRPCPIDLPGGRNGGKLVGLIYRDMLFVRMASLSEIGIKAETEAGGATRLTGRAGKSMSLKADKISDRVVVELASGKSPPERMTAPAADVAGSEYIVPFRKVLTELGFAVEWNDARKAVSVAPDTVAVRF